VPCRDDGEGVGLDAVLDVAWEAGLRSILCEGGGKVASAFLRSGLAGRLYLFVAPRVLGATGVPAFPGLTAGGGGSGWELAAPPARFGRDALLTLDPMEA
jgi:diaminohydroxyphosphoribosylaminopyrimidine deaminase / 5-amino-6-(5-phosphoribosylamino)uracil reductase